MKNENRKHLKIVMSDKLQQQLQQQQEKEKKDLNFSNFCLDRLQKGSNRF